MSRNRIEPRCFDSVIEPVNYQQLAVSCREQSNRILVSLRDYVHSSLRLVLVSKTRSASLEVTLHYMTQVMKRTVAQNILAFETAKHQ